jgi:Leucine-rich repeat (LRR) protein
LFTTGEGNSPAANPSSNNIDNKIANKPKRNNKTAAVKSAGTGLRRGLNTPTANTLTPKVAKPDTKSGLLFFSNAKLLNANSATRDLEFEEDEERAENVHQSSVRGRSGARLMSGTGHWKVLSSTGHPTNKSGSLSTKLNERVQVIRSFEEREQSPESIRMDGMGLKTFPYIGGGEGPNLKLLSLQRNLISRLENISLHMSHLVVLDLYDNRIERITGLQGFPSLRVLLLGKNR